MMDIQVRLDLNGCDCIDAEYCNPDAGHSMESVVDLRNEVVAAYRTFENRLGELGFRAV